MVAEKTIQVAVRRGEANKNLDFLFVANLRTKEVVSEDRIEQNYSKTL